MNSAVKIVRVCIGGGNFTGRKRRILSSRTTIACCVMERRFLSASRFNHSCTSRGISFINRPGITNLRYHFAIIILSSYHYVNLSKISFVLLIGNYLIQILSRFLRWRLIWISQGSHGHNPDMFWNAQNLLGLIFIKSPNPTRSQT